jgi:hypothetical protein
MGRIVDLCGEIAAAAEEGQEGLVLPAEEWERLGQDWSEDEIEDALQLVRESLLQSELVEAADSLSGRLVDLLGAFGEEGAFRAAESGAAGLSIEVIGQLARRLARLEDVLEAFRDRAGPDRRGLDALQLRLADLGIEEEMGSDADPGDADEDELEDD